VFGGTQSFTSSRFTSTVLHFVNAPLRKCSTSSMLHFECASLRQCSTSTMLHFIFSLLLSLPFLYFSPSFPFFPSSSSKLLLRCGQGHK
jgi:hypothetical protein